jgi:hypothetical protein
MSAWLRILAWNSLHQSSIHQIHSGFGYTAIRLNDSVDPRLLANSGLATSAFEHVDPVGGQFAE